MPSFFFFFLLLYPVYDFIINKYIYCKINYDTKNTGTLNLCRNLINLLMNINLLGGMNADTVSF